MDRPVGNPGAQHLDRHPSVVLDAETDVQERLGTEVFGGPTHALEFGCAYREGPLSLIEVGINLEDASHVRAVVFCDVRDDASRKTGKRCGQGAVLRSETSPARVAR